MKIAIASDHGGYFLKQALLGFLENEQIQVEDFGIHTTQSVDYPDYAGKVAQAILSGSADFGILVCGTGLGMSIAANKISGIRAVAVSDVYSARMAKEHNDANVLCLGGRILDSAKAIRLVSAWLQAVFQGGRHLERLQKIKALENRS